MKKTLSSATSLMMLIPQFAIVDNKGPFINGERDTYVFHMDTAKHMAHITSSLLWVLKSPD